MPACYWTLCHCPDATPCAEHQGFRCSLHDGAAVTDESQVADTVTRTLEAALLMMSGDDTRIQTTLTTLKSRKADLQRIKDELERDTRAATNRAQRRSVVERAEKENDAIKRLADEMDTLMDELDAMTSRWQTAIATGSGRLILPYTDAGGYCACHDRKKQRLAVIAAQIATEQATYGNLRAQYSAIRAAVLGYLTDIRNWAGGLVTAAIVAAWIYLGIGETALLGILVALIVIALALFALVIHVATLISQMDATERRLAAAILMYYRLQKISTCEKTDPSAGDDSGWFEWYFDWLDKPLPSGH
jgi:hypothetical protein